MVKSSGIMTANNYIRTFENHGLQEKVFVFERRNQRLYVLFDPHPWYGGGAIIAKVESPKFKEFGKEEVKDNEPYPYREEGEPGYEKYLNARYKDRMSIEENLIVMLDDIKEEGWYKEYKEITDYKFKKEFYELVGMTNSDDYEDSFNEGGDKKVDEVMGPSFLKKLNRLKNIYTKRKYHKIS